MQLPSSVFLQSNFSCLHFLLRFHKLNDSCLTFSATRYLIRAKFVDVGQVELDMASLCVGYLALPGFEIILPDESVTDFISTGYYAFLDYAVCFWSFHLQEGLKGTIDREDAMTLIGFLSKFLESHYRRPTKDFNIPSSAHELRRRIEEHGPWSAADNFLHAFVSAQSQINCYTQDAASNVCLNIPDVISRIRDNIERAVSENVGSGRIDSRVLYSFYGRNLYKCPRTSCDFFHQGFETPQQRESHLSKHDRPFGCSFPQCYRATIRFGLKRQLEKHIADTHEKHAREMHAFPSKRIRRALLCRFCKKEFQETSTFRKHDCTRPAPERSENLDTTDMSSTPGVKATRRKPHVTNLEWLSPDEVENMSRLREQDKVRYKQPVHNRGTILNGYGPVSPEYWIELSNAITKARELQEYQQNQRPIKQQEQSHDTQAVQQATAPDNVQSTSPPNLKQSSGYHFSPPAEPHN